jgi:hypothetical protein
MHAATQAGNHPQARLAIVAAGVMHNQRRIPVEFGHVLE